MSLMMLRSKRPITSPLQFSRTFPDVVKSGQVSRALYVILAAATWTLQSNSLDNFLACQDAKIRLDLGPALFLALSFSLITVEEPVPSISMTVTDVG